MFATTTASKIGQSLAAFTMLFLALAAGQAQAQDGQRFSSMKEGMKALAENIQTQLAGQGQNTLAIKSFEGPAGASSSSRIAQALTEQLSALSPKVDTTTAPGNWSVAGNFFVDQNKDSGKAEIFIESTLKTPQGKPHSKLVTPIITNDTETLTMFGVTGTLPTSTTPEQKAAGKDLAEVRAEALVQSIDKPKVVVEPAAAPGAPPTVVKAAPESPFAMEILIAGKPVVGAVVDNSAFVDIPKDAIYAVRLINNSDLDVGVTLAIDGINTLEFSEVPSFKQIGKWVIGRKSSGVVTGWFFKPGDTKSFQVMELARTPAAAQAAGSKDIGTITAVFCGAFEGQLPIEESRTKGGLATGLGPQVAQNFKPVERKFGLDRAAISIRYTKPDDLPPPEVPTTPTAPPAAPPKLAN
jgi:hypothetical protein